MKFKGYGIVFAQFLTLLLFAPERDSAQNGPSRTQIQSSANVEDLKRARGLLKEKAEALRLYGTLDDEEGKKLSATFQEYLVKVSRGFPLLDEKSRPETNRFFKLVLNEHGAGFDGFRFRNDSSEPKNFGWLFAIEHPCSMEEWSIAPVETQKMEPPDKPFPPKLIYTNAPWNHASRACFETTQFLRDGSILPGKEYIVWFSFHGQRPNVVHLAYNLLPTTKVFLSRDDLDKAFGLKGIPKQQ